jgi:hypothetical protein
MQPTVVNKEFPVICFAPDLSDETLTNYKNIIYNQPDGPIKDALLHCYDLVDKWWNIPVSTEEPLKLSVIHKSKRINIPVTPLDIDTKETLDPLIPWEYEIPALQTLFGAITENELRNMAHHLLWFVIELCNVREPLTQSVLK